MNVLQKLSRVKGQYFDVKWDYTYDQYNQLIGAENSKGDSYAYTYDSIGNRLQAVENGKIRDFSYNKLNQISNDGYAYDAWGNMTKAPETAYKYDLKNRLISVKKKDGTVVKYEYDPQAQRIASTANSQDSTMFLMSGMVELARNTGTPQYHTLGLDMRGTLEQTGAIGSILASNDMQYLYDGNGNVTAVVKDNAITDKLVYEPFGKQTAGALLLFTFSSKPVDKSEMSYYGYRFLDIGDGKWTNRDTIQELGGVNLYGFVFSNPISQYDLKGANPAICAAPEATVIGIELLSKVLVMCGVTTCTWTISEKINQKKEEFKFRCFAGVLQCALFATLYFSETQTRTLEEPRTKCPPCPTPPPNQVHPNTPGEHGCANGHWHKFVYNQNPTTCECYLQRLFGGCL